MDPGGSTCCERPDHEMLLGPGQPTGGGTNATLATLWRLRTRAERGVCIPPAIGVEGVEDSDGQLAAPPRLRQNLLNDQ